LVKITLDLLLRKEYNIHYKESKKENNMFGISKRIFRKTIKEVVDIVAMHHDNVTALQGALEHLGEAVKNMHELLLVQEARLQLLEDKNNEHK
jgi:prephenate dehydrogenase